MITLAFVSDGEAAVAEEPTDRSLDPPAVTAESFAGLDAGPGDARGDAPLAEPSAVLSGVICLVGPEFDRPTAARSTPGAHRRYPPHQRPQGVGVVNVRAGDADDERKSLRVGQHVQLAALFASVDRVWPGQ